MDPPLIYQEAGRVGVAVDSGQRDQPPTILEVSLPNRSPELSIVVLGHVRLG
jgi:hypothetical protein